MKYEQYKFKFYLNASHAIYIRGRRGQTHPHTWEISIDTMKLKNDFIQFDRIEKMIEQDMSKLQDTDLNAHEPFDTVNPTLENICVFFRKRIEKILNENGWIILLIEVSETPSRSYVINTADEESLLRQHAELEKHFSQRDSDVIAHEVQDILNAGN
jgi:6-pyruvoyltetrahydropterin/6-carboxytetrahydropterin synthase